MAIGCGWMEYFARGVHKGEHGEQATVPGHLSGGLVEFLWGKESSGERSSLLFLLLQKIEARQFVSGQKINWQRTAGLDMSALLPISGFGSAVIAPGRGPRSGASRSRSRFPEHLKGGDYDDNQEQTSDGREEAALNFQLSSLYPQLLGERFGFSPPTVCPGP
jgi:hypothetical protein